MASLQPRCITPGMAQLRSQLFFKTRTLQDSCSWQLDNRLVFGLRITRCSAFSQLHVSIRLSARVEALMSVPK